MAEFQLEGNEKKIDEWMLNYLPPFGGRYVGSLIITDENVYFLADFTIDWQPDAVVPVEGGLRFSRKDITSVKKVTAWLIFQRVEVKVKDGTLHTFDRGIMPMSGVLDALGGER